MLIGHSLRALASLSIVLGCEVMLKQIKIHSYFWSGLKLYTFLSNLAFADICNFAVALVDISNVPHVCLSNSYLGIFCLMPFYRAVRNVFRLSCWSLLLQLQIVRYDNRTGKSVVNTVYVYPSQMQLRIAEQLRIVQYQAYQ